MVMPSGTTVPMDTLTIRATEYTVGPDGPMAMPAPLPPSSAYTYAVELSADEALAHGATSVEFSQPLPFYVENFLGFPVGGAVPAGYYDRARAAWVPSENGRVIQVVSLSGGFANLDVDGDGTADSGGGAQRPRDHRCRTPAPGGVVYGGAELWRVPITHFTPWDCNWPYGPPPDATPPNQPESKDDEAPCESQQPGSIIGCQSQTLGESLPVTGTPFRLHYGAIACGGGRPPATSSPAEWTGRAGELETHRARDCGRGAKLRVGVLAAPNQTTTFTWDGLDAYGRHFRVRSRW